MLMQGILEQCLERQGWQLPPDVVSYCSSILEDHIARPDWQPQPSYAEQYLKITKTREALALGNECWFTRAVFPELMQRRGIQPSYYVDLGQSCWDRVLDRVENPTLRLLRDHFEFTAEVAWTAVHSQGGFRSMWT